MGTRCSDLKKPELKLFHSDLSILKNNSPKLINAIRASRNSKWRQWSLWKKEYYSDNFFINISLGFENTLIDHTACGAHQ